MKLLIISSHFLNNNGGGEGERALQLMNHLQKTDFNSSILTFKLDNKSIFDGASFKIHEISFFNNRYKFPIINYKTLKQIYNLISEADTIHIMGYWSILNVISYPFIRWKLKPYSICTAGSLNITGRSRFLKKLFNFFIGKSLIKNAYKCISIVSDEQEIFCKYGANIDNIINIPNGIDKADNVLKNNIKIIGNLNLSKSYILFVGRLNYIKGPDLLLDAFILISKKFPDHSLVFVGHDEGLKNEMLSKVDKCKLQDRVIFLGYQSGKEKSALYHNASLVVIPSRSEAMSIVFLEAAVHKTPVVLTNNCGLNHIEKFNITIICEASSAEIAKSITKILVDKNWNNIVSKKLYNFVLKNYSWDTIIKLYIDVFENSILKFTYKKEGVTLYLRQFIYFFKTKNFIKLNNYPTATHAPVLIGIAKNFIINNVLELGSGNISTSIFLNPSLYKNLVNLTTYENNKVWYNFIKMKHKKNSKWNFKYVNETVSLALEKEVEKKNTYDLIFIDDSNTSYFRSLTIKYAINIKNTFLVIHDYENSSYKEEIKHLNHQFVVSSLTPQTVILYNGNEKIKIKNLLDNIKYYSKKIEVNDYKNWEKNL